MRFISKQTIKVWIDGYKTKPFKSLFLLLFLKEAFICRAKTVNFIYKN